LRFKLYILQVWFRVNELLPLELQKRLPDGPSSAISMSLQDEGDVLEEFLSVQVGTQFIDPVWLPLICSTA